MKNQTRALNKPIALDRELKLVFGVNLLLAITMLYLMLGSI